jgi:hypothetical protein
MISSAMVTFATQFAGFLLTLDNGSRLNEMDYFRTQTAPSLEK